MQAGRMRKRITLLAPPATSSDGIGGTTAGDETVFASVWASVEPVSSGERDRAAAVQSARTHRVTLRYRPGIVETMRVGLGSRRFRITGILDLEELHRELELTCVELGNEATT